MKKYRLKKDIPGHKAGEIFEMGICGDLLDEQGHCAYLKETIERHPGIMDWFEGTRWKPDSGEHYYAVDEEGGVKKMVNNVQYRTDASLAIGNCFRTEEEAKKHREWLKAVTVLQEDTANQQVNWGKPTCLVWQVHYDYHARMLDVNGVSFCRECPFVFGDKADANRSIDEHKKEWLTFLGVD